MRQFTTSSAISTAIPSGARLFLNLLTRIRHGHLQLITPDGNCIMFGDLHQPPSATMKINDWRACNRIIRAGDIGFAEAYGAGWIDSPDLAALLRLALRNEAVLERMVFGGSIAKVWYKIRHWLRPNTRKGSQRNIHAHYDIGNDFYRLWLDPSWTYSSAIFDGDYSQSLHNAQIRKYQRIIDTLDLHPGDHVLEIGCGWGGFAEHAARHGIRVHGITISPSQLVIATERMERHGFRDLVKLELCDYRDVRGSYDAIVSIEMFEAVGEQFWPDFFQIVQSRLKRCGKALIQSITIAEQCFERYRSSTDFIQQYIFPGGMLPSVRRFVEHASRVGLATIDQFSFGPDYAETLRRWNASCEQEREQVLMQGFDAHFIRIWHLYFAYCEAGFDEGRTNVVQFCLQKQ